MASYHEQSNVGTTLLEAVADRIGIGLQQLMGSIKEGLLAMAVAVGLQVMQRMMEEEVDQIVGTKGKHNSARKTVRHGSEKRSVVLGGRKVVVDRPRVRTIDGREMRLETYEAFRDTKLLTQVAIERMLHGLSCRQYRYGLEPVGESISQFGTSKSAISRRFIQETRKALAELMSKPIGPLNLVALFIDGVVLAGHTIVAAMGLDVGGQKHILGLWEGATENSALCKSLLSDLVCRGLRTDQPLLVVIDGSKALAAAVRDVLGKCAVVQRCQVHKKRNVLEHLPEDARVWVKRKLDQAYNETDYVTAIGALQTLASALGKEYPGAAASLREGLEETLTVVRLGLPELLSYTLRSTNAIESVFERVKTVARNVKRWRSGEQVLRWTAAAALEAESRFHRIAGYRDIPLLIQALRKEVLPDTSREVKTA
ncbi:MAG: IS256 family transposase [Anaerolineae bacterium]